MFTSTPLLTAPFCPPGVNIHGVPTTHTQSTVGSTLTNAIRSILSPLLYIEGIKWVINSEVTFKKVLVTFLSVTLEGQEVQLTEQSAS